jgi:hypothetical protein
MSAIGLTNNNSDSWMNNQELGSLQVFKIIGAIELPFT